jgi:hypothetical protein
VTASRERERERERMKWITGNFEAEGKKENEKKRMISRGN